MPEEKDYTAKHITVLASLEAVRKRPSMYIGSTGPRGLHHLVYEIVDNSIDEAMAGHCTKIHVTIHKGNSVTVVDDGRGIPVDIHPKFKISALEVVMTKLHAGGKFDRSSYKVSGGLHGVGISVVNALSTETEVTVKKNGKIHYQKYVGGKPTEKVKILGKTTEMGTKVKFSPDPKIFDTIEFNFDTLSARLRELAFLNKGVEIILTDEREDQEHKYLYEGGIIEFVEFLNKNKSPLHNVIYFTKEKEGIVFAPSDCIDEIRLVADCCNSPHALLFSPILSYHDNRKLCSCPVLTRERMFAGQPFWPGKRQEMMLHDHSHDNGHHHDHDHDHDNGHHHDHDHDHEHHHDSLWGIIAEALHLPGHSHSHDAPSRNDPPGTMGLGHGLDSDRGELPRGLPRPADLPPMGPS